MVSTSLMANGLWSNAVLAQAALCGGQMHPHPPREQAGNALNNLYRSSDGRWFHLIMITGEHLWDRFAEVTGHTELLTDRRFKTAEKRSENADALIDLLDGMFLERDAAEWRELLTQNGFNFGESRAVEDIPNDQQLRDGGALTPINDPRAGSAWIVDSPIQVAGLEKQTPTLAPEVGEHTDEILRSAGYGDDKIVELREQGVVG